MSQLFDFSLGEKPWGKPNNLEKTKKTKTFQRMFGLRLMFVFFLVFPRVFFVFFVMTLKKLKKLKFFLVFWRNSYVEVRQKTKKTRLFWFLDRFLEDNVTNNPCKKPKKTWVFLVFPNSLTINLSKKPKKPWVFLVFSKSWPKKNQKTRQNQKKTNMSLRPNILWKVLFFLVFLSFRGTGQLFDFSLGEKPWGKPKKPRENQKTKKPKLFRECLVWGSCLFFFLVLPRFFLFFFGHDLEKTKKTQGFFVFLDKLMVKRIVVTCLLKICPKTKKRRVFLVFCLTSSKSSFKKPKKTWVFLVFSRSWPKKTKNSRKTKKKSKHEPQTKHSLKSFGFLVFSRFFGFWFSLEV